PPGPRGRAEARLFRTAEGPRGPSNRPRDQLTCATLKLTPVPADKARPKDGAQPEAGADAPAGDTASNLTLRRADATGHNVRLLSAGQGVKARCNELIHKKLLPDAPDETYFRGDATTRLVVEKEDVAAEGPDKGKGTGYTP